MPSFSSSSYAFIFEMEHDLRANRDRYAEAAAWWNGNYSLTVRRREIAARLREIRKTAKPTKWKPGMNWKRQHQANWSFLARVRDAMHTFSRDRTGWHRLSIQQAKRITLITVLITRPDFDATKAGLQEAAQWSEGRLLDDSDPFGRDWADAGSFPSWNDEDGDNGRWHKLAETAWQMLLATPEPIGTTGVESRESSKRFGESINEVKSTSGPSPGDRAHKSQSHRGFCSPSDIARAMNVPNKAEAIRKALKRLLDDDRLPDEGWLENSNPAHGQAKILYCLSIVRPLLSRFEENNAG